VQTNERLTRRFLLSGFTLLDPIYETVEEELLI